MDPKDAHKTAFSSSTGYFEFARMPFGLLIYATSLEEHTQKLKSVFQRLREHNLKLQPDKCHFLQKEIVYLGHVITPEGVMPDPKKVEAITLFPIPKNATLNSS